MTFPFKITEQILDAYQAHQAYTSAGQKWLLRNDPECQNEVALLEEIVTQIEAAAREHFGQDEDGDDTDAYYEFCDDVGLAQVTSGEWYDIVGAELETTE